MKLTEKGNPETVSSVLVEAPTFLPEGWEACMDLLGRTAPERTDLLVVTLNAHPSFCLDQWVRYGSGERPANVAFVTASDETPAGAGTGEEDGERSTWDGQGVPDRYTVETVSNAGDLTELGTRILTVLDRWDDHDARTVLCFRGLSVLLQYRGVDPSAQFVRAVSNRVERTGDQAHFHIDPEAHDTATLETFREILDGRVRATDAGTDR